MYCFSSLQGSGIINDNDVNVLLIINNTVNSFFIESMYCYVTDSANEVLHELKTFKVDMECLIEKFRGIRAESPEFMADKF